MATIAQVTTKDGYKIRAFNSMYIDYGLEIIAPDGREYYSPSALSSDSYGVDDCDECENDGFVPGCAHKECGHTPWNISRWKEVLLSEADCFIEAYMWDPEYFED